ncbi:chemokine-like protein TAFA-5 isoform X1 [Petromyzon marinus]|uniref:Chemokine-like protein TAFA-5 isoform X1 n=2 Tax=Petromyzon marinus TaxID=7757 RepID=A0AAJ7TM28_PETMA|nr:chemokine-like protein TAFA-5 isoform X1 [Petromyzon marinus]
MPPWADPPMPPPRALCLLGALAAAGILVVVALRNRASRDGQLAVGTCEVVALDRDGSDVARTVARQTARCACRRGRIAGTTRARPACVEARVIRGRQWCEMRPCALGEQCAVLANQAGWTCTQPGGRTKTTTVS